LPIHIKFGSVQNQTTNVAIVVFKVIEDAIAHLEGRKERDGLKSNQTKEGDDLFSLFS